jgi:hypothetical protein
VVRGEQQAGAFALKPLADGCNFFRRHLLLGKEVIQAKHHERVGICEDSFVNRQLEAGLVDALKHCHRMAGGLAGNLLEAESGTVEKLQCTCDPL